MAAYNNYRYCLLHNYSTLSWQMQDSTITLVMDMNNNFRLGHRIRELRTISGLTQEEAAFRANITPAYWGQIERNLKNPTVMILQKICDALDFPISEFFTDLPPAARELDEPSLQILHLLEKRSLEEKEILLQMMKLLDKLDAVGRADGPSPDSPAGNALEGRNRDAGSVNSTEEASKKAVSKTDSRPQTACNPDISCGS